MNIHLTTLTRVPKNPDCPKLAFFADWLIPMGFVHNSLVQFLPETNGLSLTLCETISKYSELVNTTHEKGGTLVNAKMYDHKDCVFIGFTGAALKQTGLACGDVLLMRYEYGFIRMRKLPDVGKIVTARLLGDWLNDLGFTPDSVVLVGSEKGRIDCTLHENGRDNPHELVAFARKHKLTLVQVCAKSDNSYRPMFEIPPARLESAGFNPHDSFIATYEYGRITLRPIDFEALGF